jgi:hypothetical protein
MKKRPVTPDRTLKHPARALSVPMRTPAQSQGSSRYPVLLAQSEAPGPSGPGAWGHIIVHEVHMLPRLVPDDHNHDGHPGEHNRRNDLEHGSLHLLTAPSSLSSQRLRRS